MTATYEGFTRKQKLFVVCSAIVAVFMSLAFAAWIMEDAFRNMQFSQQDQEVVNRLLGDTADPVHKSILRAHAIDTVANLKQLANRQSIIIVAFAGAFALSAVGIALFLLGADSAFQLQSGQGKGGMQLLLAGTAPGILCLLLAVTLMGIAIAYRSSVNLTSTPLTKPIVGASEKSASTSPAGVDPAAKAVAENVKGAAEQRNADQEARNHVTEKAAAAKMATEKAVADKLIADELAAAKSAANRAVNAKLAAEKSAADKLAAEKAAANKLAADRASEATLARNRAAADKSVVEKAKAERAAATKLATERTAVEKLAVDRATVATAAANKIAADRAASNKLAADKSASGAARAEKAVPDAVDVARLTAERIAVAGTPSEIYKRAVALRNGGETSQALALLKYASSSGHGPSSRLLALIYRDGAPDVRANFRQAERYQALADVQGDR